MKRRIMLKNVFVVFFILLCNVSFADSVRTGLFTFDNLGKSVSYQEVFDGKIIKITTSTGENIADLEKADRNEFVKKHGALLPKLVRQIVKLNDTDSLKIKIILKHPEIPVFDKNLYTDEQIKKIVSKYSKKMLIAEPYISRTEHAKKHKLSISDAETSSVFFQTKTNKLKLMELAFDSNVAAIEDVYEPKPVATAVELLITSAYNSGNMVYLGTAMNNATFENILTLKFQLRNQRTSI